ncbi:MAG: Fe-Mn family superoxide dismutase [Elusimicrobiota bacterium]|jgi:Fe-Mn family superoxide dismutase
MPYTAKTYELLLGTAGFSDQLLKNHFTLYQGYVTNTNKLSDLLAGLAKDGKTETPEYAELKRRFGWEFSGMRLHEIYFGNMVKGGNSSRSDALSRKLQQEFGSPEAWEKDFRATGAMRGIGWALLYYDPIGDRLFNTWINEHDGGHLVSSVPLFLMDVFEHAFMIDYGTKRAGYIDSFFKAIDWSVVSQRFDFGLKAKLPL